MMTQTYRWCHRCATETARICDLCLTDHIITATCMTHSIYYVRSDGGGVNARIDVCPSHEAQRLVDYNRLQHAKV